MSKKKTEYSKFYKTAGFTIEIRSDLPILENTFHSKFKHFEINIPDKKANIILHHHFDFYSHADLYKMESVYVKPPWRIFKSDNKLVYKWIYPKQDPPIPRVAYTDIQHEKVNIYNDERIKHEYLKGNIEFLSMFPTDQIILGAALAYLNGCILHSSGVVVDGKGYLFIGHSGAGKSTIASMFLKQSLNSKILCEDRNILRKINHTFFIGSAWSHNDIQRLSSESPPLCAIFFLQQSENNRLTQITDKGKLATRLLEFIIKPYTHTQWWGNVLHLLDQVVNHVPCWSLEFNKSGDIVEKITTSNIS